MATLIGVVSQVVGEVYAVAGDGTRRPLVEGDRVYAGEQLETGAAGAVAVTLTNGEVLTLGRDSSLGLNEQMLAGGDGQTAQPQEQAPATPTDGDLTDVEQLQAAIEAGVDPTQAGEATAAGPGAGGGGAGGAGGVGGGHSFVLLGEVGGALDPVIGFPTEGLNTGPEFPDPEPIVTDDPAPDGAPFAADASAEVDEDGDPGLPERNPGGPDDSPAPSQVSGSLNYSFGPDGPGSFVWNAPNLLAVQSQGHALSVEISGDGQTLTAFYILGGAGGEGEDIRVDVFEVVNAGGTYTFTLFEPLDHPIAGTEDELLLQIPFTVTDSDGDAASALLNVVVDDDTPTLFQGEGEGQYFRGIRGSVQEDALTKIPDSPDDSVELFVLPPIALDAPYEGNNEDSDPVGSDADPDQTVTFSSHTTPGVPPLSALVDFGADRIGSFGLVDTETANEVLGSLGLTSGDVPLTYEVTIYDDGGVPPSVLYTELVAYAGGTPIFTLQVEADGNFTFTLQGPIDHPLANGDDSEHWSYEGDGEETFFGIDFTHVLTATDFDGDPVAEFQDDSVDGLLVIQIEDDVPRLAGSENQRPIVEATVHDDALTTGAPYEGNNEDGDGVGEDADPAQRLTVSGGPETLWALVEFGADGPGEFSLISIGGDSDAATAALESLTSQGLESGGQPLQFRMDGGVLVGYVENAGSGSLSYDVFSLEVGADGSYSFTLLGPIDHPVPEGGVDGDDELLSDGEGAAIDFSGVLAATDGDGDPLVGGFPVGSFVIDVEDDVPVLAERGEEFEPVGGTVHEDALAVPVGGSAPHEGNDDDPQTLTVSGGPGALSALVVFGADGSGEFGLSNSEAAFDSLDALGLTSGGEGLQYNIDSDTGLLTAFVTGTEAGDYDVFTLQVNADGSYTFTLKGPLDHEVDDGNDSELLGDSGLAIDFSGVLTATDGDGDPLAGGFSAGSFVIDVQDDVPVLADRGEKFEPIGGLVNEDALVSPAPHDGNDDTGQALTASGGEGSLHALVNFGADGPGEFSLIDIDAGGDAADAALATLTAQGLESGGQALQFRMDGDVLMGFVEGTEAGNYDVFSLDINADGSWLFTLLGPIDHPLQNGDDAEALSSSGLAIDFSGVLAATDGDGDPLVGGFEDGSLVIDVQDDVPVFNGGAAVGTTLTVSLEGGDAGYANTYGYYVKDALGNPVSGTIIWANIQDVGAPLQLEGVNPESIGFFIIPNGATNNALAGYEDGAELTFAEISGEWQAFLDGQPLLGSGGANVLFDNPLLNPSGSAQFTDNGAPGNQNWEDVSGGGDGDFNDVNIQVDWQGAIVHEDALSSGGGAPHDGNLEGGQTTMASGPAGSLSALVNFGADGPGVFGLSSDTSSMDLQGLTSGTVALTYLVLGNVLTASAGSQTIFTLTVNGDGSWEFVLQGPIDHPEMDGNDLESLPGLGVDFSGILTATDGDGDPLLGSFPSGSFAVDIEDDVPVAKPLQYDDRQNPIPLVSADVDEDELPNGISDSDSEGTSVSGPAGTLNALVSFGADGPGSFGLDGSDSAIDSLEAQGLTSDGTPLTFSVVGNVLTAYAGVDPVFTLSVTAGGGYSFELLGPLDHPLPGSTDDDQLLGLPIDFSGVLTATDGDGDPVDGFADGSFVINLEDDVPVAQNDNATVLSGQAQNINLVFVLDFSGSIDNTELNAMLDAVRAAGQELFNTATGAVQIQIVAFSGTSVSFPMIDNIADFTALVNSLNPQEPGGARPLNGLTDFTDAIQETMTAYTPLPGWTNQVIFISDGNPNEQTGPGGAPSLTEPTATDWNNFVDNNGINVTTIGIGDNIDDPRLEDIDVDAGANNDPLRVDDFDDLVDTLVDQVIGGLVGGNVLLGNDNAVGGGDDDAFGADGRGQVLSIEINGTTYTWDGTADGDQQLTEIATAEGGKLSFNFSTGAWSYQAPDSVDGDKIETFTYTIIDNDGDPSTATLQIYVEDGSPVEATVTDDAVAGGIPDGDGLTASVSGSVASLAVGPDTAVFSLNAGGIGGLTGATSGGVALVYSISSNVLTATAGPAGPTVFTLEVGPSGSYTFTLDRALDHPLGNGDDNEQLTLNFASVLEAETAGGAPVDLAGAFLIHVEDDVPVVDILPNSAASVAEGSTYDGTWTHGMGGDGAGSIKVLVGPNEYNLDTNISLASGTLRVNSDGTWSFQAGSGLDQDVINSQTFSVRVRDYDQDTATDSFTIRITDAGSPTGGQTSNAVDEEGLTNGIAGGPNDAAGTDTTVTGNLGYSFGPDGAAPVGAFTWSTAGLPALTSGGTALTYSVSADGLTLTAAKVGGGATVFTVKVTNVSTGAYEFKLLQPLDHSAPVSPTGSDENNIDLSFAYTVKDDDGSTANGSLGISVDDDSPAVNLLPDTPVNMAEGTTYSSGTWSGGYGADGGGSAKVLVGANEYSLNTNIALDTGILRVNSNGTWSFQAANGLDQDIYNSQSFSVQVRDYDQDTVTDSVTINIADAAKPSGGTANNAVDEEGLSNGITGGPNDAAGTDTTVTGNLGYSFGPDGAAPVGAFAWSTAGLPALTSGGTALTYSVSADGLTLTAAKVGGGATVFTVKVTDVATGAYEFKLLLPLDHPAPVSPTGSDENNIGLSFGYTVQDDDGSTANGSLGISVDDDSPAVNLLPDAPVNVAEGTSYNSGTWTSGYGADGAGSIKVLVGANEYNLDADIALATGTLRVNSDGTWSFQAANGLDQDVINSQSFSVRVRDYDQDTVTDSLTINITDAAKPTGGAANNAVDEDGLANGVAGGPNDAAGADTTVTGTLGYSFGADGAAPVGAFTWSTGGLPALTSGGTALTYSVSSDGLTLTAAKTGGGATVFTVKVTDVATGAYEFKLLLPLDHSAPVSPVTSDENNINLNFSYTVKDDDGSTANGSLGISVDDDSPTAKDNTISVTEGGVPPFNLILVVDTSGSMLYEIGGNTQGSPNRLELAKEALSNMIDSYAALGVDLAITVIDFATGALLIPQTTDPDVAKLNIQNLATDGGNTNYNAPLVLAQNQLTADLVNLPDYEHRVYFLSDGQPNVGNVPAGWTSFIDASGAEVYAVGLSVSGNAGAIAQLGLVEDHGDAVTLIDDPYDLDATLQATVPQPTMGNMVTDVDPVDGVDTSGADVPVTVTQISFVAADPSAYIGVADSIVGNVVTFLVQGGTTGPIETPLGGTLVVNANGSYSYTPPNDVLVDSQEVFTYTIVDKDGDKSSADLTINVLDTSPIVANVYEDGLPNGLPDPDSNVTSVSGTLAGAVVDSAGVTFSLGSVAGLPALTADGVAITYSVVDGPTSDTLTAKAGTVNIFTLVLQANGSYTFNLLGAIDHATANGDDQELKDLDLSSVIVAKEGATNVPLIRDFIVQVEDDVPVAFTPVTAVLVDQVNDTRFITESLRFEDSAGADGPDQVVFSIVEGTAARDASGNLLSMNGQQLYLFYGSDQSIVEAKTSAGGTLAYRIDMDASTDSYTLTTYGPIANGSEVSATNLTGVGGGNVRYKGLIDMGGTNFDALLSTTSGESVNTNSSEIGITDGNRFDDGERMRLDLVNGLATGGANGTGFTYTSHNTTNRFAQKVAWVSPSGSGTATLIVSVLLADDDYNFIGDASGETTRNLSTSNIRVYAIESGVEVDKTGLVDLDDLGNSIRISGMEEGWWYEVSTTSAFSAVVIEGDDADDGEPFKLGFFEYDQASTGQPINLSHNIVGIDSDGDSVSSTLKATLVPDSLSVDGGAGIDNLVGTAQADYLFGNGGNDTLSGLAGNDVLSGGTGNDLIIGGLGNDILAGGVGADVFRWQAADTTGADKVLDFKPSEGDKLDLTQLLVGETYNAGSLDDFLHFSVVDNSTVISVSPTAGGATTTTIELTGFNVAAEYGVTPGGGGIISAGADTATVINGLLGDNALQVA